MNHRPRHVLITGGLLAVLSTAGCGPRDYESFEDYTDKLNQRFEQTHDCHSLLEMPASMMDGRAYRAAPVEFGAGGDARYVAENWVYDQDMVVAMEAYEGVPGDAPPCSDGLYSYLYDYYHGMYWDYENSYYEPGAKVLHAAGFQVPGAKPSGFAAGVFNDLTESTSEYATFSVLRLALGGPATGQVAWSGVFGGAWVCTESYTGPVGTHYAPPDWTGVMFIHSELWELPDGSLRQGGTTLSREYGGVDLPLDVIVRLEDVDCARSEDANDPDLNYYCYNWTRDCDGIDNDLDGEIDEGIGVDRDGNGVADCMDDWDHDGIPNVEDPDVHDYGCGGY